MVLRTYIGIKSVDDNQMLDSNYEEEDEIELENALPQEILKNQKVIHDKNCILIAKILLYIIC